MPFGDSRLYTISPNRLCTISPNKDQYRSAGWGAALKQTRGLFFLQTAGLTGKGNSITIENRKKRPDGFVRKAKGATPRGTCFSGPYLMLFYLPAGF
jgi:hypothetical protein